MQVEELVETKEALAWQPLLAGELADQAWQAIGALAREIGPAATPAGAPPPAWDLSGGKAGMALFYSYLAEATGEESFADRALADFEVALHGAATEPSLLGLWQGLLGVSWTFDHLSGRLFESEAGEEDGDGEVSDADLLLIEHLDREEEHYDLIRGLVGFGIACLEGLPRLGARRALDRVLDQLIEKARPLEPGCGFFSEPHSLPDWQRELAPEGYYNLGLAHGIPALMVLFARCIGEGIRAEELAPLLDSAASWLLGQRGAEGFPSWIAKGTAAPRGSRLAWCYGDPGVAAAFLVAGRATGRPEWVGAAVEIACQAAARDGALAGIKDGGICHGAAGLAHIYNRLWQASGRQELAELARFYFGKLLELRRVGKGIGGFQSWSSPRGEAFVELQWVDDPGLLTGAAGIGLCLLAAVSDLDPAWDRPLLLSG